MKVDLFLGRVTVALVRVPFSQRAFIVLDNTSKRVLWSFRYLVYDCRAAVNQST